MFIKKTHHLIYILTIFFLLGKASIQAAATEEKMDKTIWKLVKCTTTNGKDLTFKSAKGMQMATYKTAYLNASVSAEIRFGSFNKEQVYYYMGFMSRSPWAKNAILLSNWGTDRFHLQVRKDGGKWQSSRNTASLEPDKWYTFKIDWQAGPVDRLEKRPDVASFYLDGVKIGTLDGVGVVPQTMLSVVFDASSKGKEEARMEVRNIQITSYGKAEREAQLSRQIPVPPNPPLRKKNIVGTAEDLAVKIFKNNEVILENSFLRSVIDLKSPRLKQLFNKYENKEMITREGSRLFVINDGGKDIPNGDFKLREAAKISGKQSVGLRTVWMDSKKSFTLSLTFTLKQNSSEMSIAAKIVDTIDKSLKLGVTLPFLENIKIGKRVEDDYYFFPMMTGWCGKLPARMRHAYGYMAWMQLLAVFNPVEACGVFMYTQDPTGMPKNLLINKRDRADRAPVPSSTGGYSDEDPGLIFNSKPGTAMAVRHLRYELKPDASCQLPEAVIGVSYGDWHDAFSHYSKWLRSWYKSPFVTPHWFMDNYDYISKHPSSFMDKGEKNYIYAKNMTPNESDGAMTEWAFWWDYPINERKSAIGKFTTGDYDYPSRRGGLAPLKKEISEIHAKGGRITLYTLSSALWQGSKIGRKHGAEWTRIERNGKLCRDWLSKNEGYCGCMYVDAFSEYMASRMHAVLKETGADGYRLDVAALIYPCYNPKHKHYNGTIRSAVAPKKLADFMKRCTEKARAAVPDAIVMGEHAGNDYMTQFFDGYLTQQFRWSIPFYAPFKGMNAYKLIFMRFLLPEKKILMFGESVAETAPVAFFNAVGIDRSGARGKQLRYLIRTEKVLKENGDAVNTMHPEPLIPTLQNGLMANAFFDKNKKIWTLYNRNSKPLDGDLIETVSKDKVHYVELLHDVPLAYKSENGKNVISGKIGAEEVVCVAELPVILKAALKNNVLEIESNANYPDLRVDVFVGNDDQSNGTTLHLKSGRITHNIQGKGNIIVKLIKGKYLLDQVVIQR